MGKGNSEERACRTGGRMIFPKWKKNLHRIQSSIERLGKHSKQVLFSAGLLGLVSTAATGEPRVPVDPKLSIRREEVTKYSGKYLLRSMGKPFVSLFAQHRS